MLFILYIDIIKCLLASHVIRTILILCLTAFLNEAGFNFVKKCVDLIETRGISHPLHV